MFAAREDILNKGKNVNLDSGVFYHLMTKFFDSGMMKPMKFRNYLKTGEANGSCDSAEVFVLLDRQRADFLLAALYLVGQSALSTKNIEFTKEMFSTQSLDLKLNFPHNQLTEQ